MLVAGLAREKNRTFHRQLLSSPTLDTASGGFGDGTIEKLLDPSPGQVAWRVSSSGLDRRPEASLIPELCPGFLSSSNALSTGTSVGMGTHDSQTALVETLSFDYTTEPHLLPMADCGRGCSSSTGYCPLPDQTLQESVSGWQVHDPST